MTIPLPADTERLSSALESVLECVRMAALDLNVDIPAYQIATTGSLAHDCEQVLVVGSGITTGLPLAPISGAPGPGPCGPSWTLVVAVDIVRCAPTVTDSGVTDTESVGNSLVTVSSDVEVLMRATTNLQNLVVGDITASLTFKAPSGSFRSTSMSLRMAIP